MLALEPTNLHKNQAAPPWAVAATAAMSRTHQPENEVVFFAMPYGTRPLNGVDGPTTDFDKVYGILEGTLTAEGMRPERLDGLYGPTAGRHFLALSHGLASCHPISHSAGSRYARPS